MRLIHRDHRNLHTPCELQKPAAHKSLRRHINNPVRTLRRPHKRHANLNLRKCTIDIRRMDPGRIQRLHLILHQRNQR